MRIDTISCVSRGGSNEKHPAMAQLEMRYLQRRRNPLIATISWLQLNWYASPAAKLSGRRLVPNVDDRPIEATSAG